ncbi:nitrogen assimilation transcription factor nirA [Trichoderma sp. SZMC 28011]
MSDRQGGKRRILARSCEFCRIRKVRCSAQKPKCASCVKHGKECVYIHQVPKARPTRAMLDDLRAENEYLKGQILQIRGTGQLEKADTNIEPAQTADEHPKSWRDLCEERSRASTPSQSISGQPTAHDPEEAAPDVSPYLWTDEGGNVNVFGPSSALQSCIKPEEHQDPVALVYVRNGLLANAVLSRQQEHRLRLLSSLDGVPIDLAIHLLDLHWNRQHHTFLLTYRPALMRDIAQGGRFSSKFLLNAIFACASKFSCRLEVLDDPTDPSTAGGRFFKRCDELVSSGNLLLSPSLPTIVGLLLLGGTYNAKGMTTKAWLMTGAALRMVYDLGLHLNHKITLENAEEVEIYRRVFWGAFICDKLQSLYLGRPVAIRPRDAHVSHELNDIMEENEPWAPYVDPLSPSSSCQTPTIPYGPIHSVSCFQQLCLLFKIVSRIIDNFYVVGATPAGAMASLDGIDAALNKWEANLPSPIQLDPSSGASLNSRRVVPNILALHIIYNAVIILLHRPLLAEGHLNLPSAAPTASWKRCTIAARNITNIAQEYRARYSLRSAPYLISYGVYVACTIHVRNAAAVGGRDSDHPTLLTWSLRCLEELSIPNSAVSRPIIIIKKLMEAKGVAISPGDDGIDCPDVGPMDADASLPQEADVQNPGFPLPLSEEYIEGGDWDWGNWTGSFNEDVLYGFMGSQSHSFGDMLPDMVSMNNVIPSDDGQHIS